MFFSQSGACIKEILHTLISRYRPVMVVVHVGINNLSKTYLYHDEFEQMAVPCNEIVQLIGFLLAATMHISGVYIITSSVNCH